MTNSFKENRVKLPDGRNLSYAEYGTPAGTPVMYFHTHPGSRLNGQFLDSLAQKHNIRIIAPDRPGCGLSDFKENRTLLDWPQDVGALADHLEIDQFAVLGASGGGPYSAVCAHQLPVRVTKAALLASVGTLTQRGATRGMLPSNRLMFGIAKLMPRLIPYMLTSTERGVLDNPNAIIQQLKDTLPAIDVQVMNSGNHWDWFIDDLKEAFQDGVQGASRDVILFSQPWGFDLKEIRIPVAVWQGEKDTNAPPAMGRKLAEEIPNATFNLYPELGHLSLILSKAEEALLWLCG